MSTPEKRKRTVEWDEANLAKNFAERSATMKIDEIETPWHSPPRELFHDLSVEDEGRAPRAVSYTHLTLPTILLV